MRREHQGAFPLEISLVGHCCRRSEGERAAAVDDKNLGIADRDVVAVHEALLRALAHMSYHVGQIVYLAKSARGNDWKTLSIPPGGSAAFNNTGLR